MPETREIQDYQGVSAKAQEKIKMVVSETKAREIYESITDNERELFDLMAADRWEDCIPYKGYEVSEARQRELFEVIKFRIDEAQ